MLRSFSISFVLLSSLACNSDSYAGGSNDGAAIYQSACARCHGGDGVPNRAMVTRTGVRPLNSERVMKLSDEEIRTQILRGSMSKTMPSFQGALSDEQISAVVGHIRTLGELAAAAESKAN